MELLSCQMSSTCTIPIWNRDKLEVYRLLAVNGKMGLKPHCSKSISHKQLIQLLTCLLSREAAGLRVETFPFELNQRHKWAVEALYKYTKGFNSNSVAFRAAKDVVALVNSMSPGLEVDQLKSLLPFIDAKGSEVRLSTGELLDGSKQPAPYPAVVWEWHSVQAHKWRAAGHINDLELLAFLNYVNLLSVKPNLHGLRFVHVLDSRVSSCVAAKGRSSSVAVNRTLRRLLAVLLACYLYPVPMWTISAWNFPDSGSRAFGPTGIT